ncbi:MAG: NifU-like protein [Verrucomicrobiota bacterium]|jgi:nitrogen fixation NifU-like protein
MKAAAEPASLELYHKLILEHGRQPRHLRRLDAPSHRGCGHNRSCGDRIDLELLLNSGRVYDCAFEGSGCAVCLASASVLCGHVVGLEEAQLRQAAADFDAMLSGGAAMPKEIGAFAALAAHPARRKCASLAWHALLNALNHHNAPAQTE